MPCCDPSIEAWGFGNPEIAGLRLVDRIVRNQQARCKIARTRTRTDVPVGTNQAGMLLPKWTIESSTGPKEEGFGAAPP